MEFILVDDESTDRTKEIILNIASEDRRFKYYSSLDGCKDLKNKKRALDVGISNAVYNYLLFTDVDCSIPSAWASTMCSYFNGGHDYLVGSSFTKYDKNLNYVSKFQRTDFLLLMIACRALASFGYPLASSGQNQGFTKILYKKVDILIGVKTFLENNCSFRRGSWRAGSNNSGLNLFRKFVLAENAKIDEHLDQIKKAIEGHNSLYGDTLNIKNIEEVGVPKDAEYI